MLTSGVESIVSAPISPGLVAETNSEGVEVEHALIGINRQTAVNFIGRGNLCGYPQPGLQIPEAVSCDIEMCVDEPGTRLE